MPATPTFREALREEVLVFDGAMGTEIYRHHVFTNRCYDELCLSDPKMIRQIHSDYCAAGADVLTTNTFGANRIALGRFGLSDRAAEINRSGASLAREVADAAEGNVFVAGSIGPLPAQPQYADQWEAMVAEQVESLVSGGADFILFETLANREAVERCAMAMSRMPDVPFVVSFALTDETETVSGESIERMLAPLPSGTATPVAWGMNCGTGPTGLLSAMEKAVHLTDQPIIVQPNAGIPKEVDNRSIYLCSPEYLTTYAMRFVALGARAVGGCCGTTPDHIREIALAVKPLSKARVAPVIQEAADEVEEQDPTPLSERSRFAWRLAHQKWVTSVELVPPRGYDLTSTVEKSRTLYRHGVDAINIPDGPRASSRISPLITAEYIQREVGIETILHFCSRDRNLIGMQADLLACAACGVHNILFVTGDPPKLGNYPQATGVFDTDSIGMVAVQHRLNAGIDLGGQSINPKRQHCSASGSIRPRSIVSVNWTVFTRRSMQVPNLPLLNRSSIPRHCCVSSTKSKSTRSRSWRASGPWPAIAMPSSCRTRFPVWRFPIRSWSVWKPPAPVRSNSRSASRLPRKRFGRSTTGLPESRSVRPSARLRRHWR